MNVAFIVTELSLTGTPQWVEVASIELKKRGHHVLVLVQHGPFDRESRFQNHDIKVKGLTEIASMSELNRLIHKENIELLHLNSWEPHGYANPKVLSKHINIPLLVHYHNTPKPLNLRNMIGFVVFPKRGIKYIQKWWNNLISVDAHIICSNIGAVGARDSFGPVNRNRIYGLPTAIHLPQLIVSTQVLQGSPRFIQVGSLIERKRPGLTLSAFNAVQKKYPDASLMFVGEGPLDKVLEHVVAEKKIKNVMFVGKTMEVDKFLLESNIFILPSILEGLPAVLVEAAGVGLPLISTWDSGMPEIVIDGETGILVPPDDINALEGAMLFLAGSPKTRTRMGKKGRDLVATKFTIEKQIDELLAIYSKVMHAVKHASRWGKRLTQHCFFLSNI